MIFIIKLIGLLFIFLVVLFIVFRGSRKLRIMNFESNIKNRGYGITKSFDWGSYYVCVDENKKKIFFMNHFPDEYNFDDISDAEYINEYNKKYSKCNRLEINFKLSGKKIRFEFLSNPEDTNSLIYIGAKEGYDSLFALLGVIFETKKSDLELDEEYENIEKELMESNNEDDDVIDSGVQLEENESIASSLINDEKLYEIDHERGKLNIYNGRLEIFKEYNELPFVVQYDENNMKEFNLYGYELSLFNDNCKLEIMCAKINDSFITDVEVLIFDIDKEEEVKEIIEFLNIKLNYRKMYKEQHKNKIEVSEEERKYGKNRYSNKKFKEFDDDKVLKFSYYGVEVKGVKYRDFDIKDISIDEKLTFEFEPTNEYDKNAIKILYNDTFIGYVPKRNVQKVLKKYICDEHKYVNAFVSKVDEEDQRIYISIGLYEVFDKNDLFDKNYYDIKLIKTSKLDEFSYMSRQENLTYVKEKDEVSLEFDYELETYVVESKELVLELGEINKKYSQELFNYECEGKKFISTIIKLETKEDKISCTIRVFVI